MTVSIVTPWLNASELIPVYAATTRGAQIIIVDNGSERQHAERLEIFCMMAGDRAIYIRNETNAGFSHANNQGLAVATGEIVMFLNNDVQGRGAWLERVELEVQPGALYGISILNKHGYDYIEGWCIAARRAVWDALNGWDQDYYAGLYWEDNDLCFRAHKAGIGLVRTTWPLWHFNNYTSSKTPGAYDNSAENEQRFLRRIAEWSG
jgi:GT2 family glycosyltransferase